MPARKPKWQQLTALVSLSAGGTVAGLSFAPGAHADVTSPSSVPLRLLALERLSEPGQAGGQHSDTALRSAIVNVARYYLQLAKGKTPAQMEAIIWQHVSTDGADHGQSCAAFASLTLEVGAQAAGQQSWVTGGATYPWPLHQWADARVDPNPDSLSITSIQQDAAAHGRWHPLGDGYQPQPGDWVMFDGHVEVVTGYSGGVLSSIGADSLPGYTVNAHEFTAPLAGTGVQGFVDNGSLPSGTPAGGSSTGTGTGNSPGHDNGTGSSTGIRSRTGTGGGSGGGTGAGTRGSSAAGQPAAIPGLPAGQPTGPAAPPAAPKGSAAVPGLPAPAPDPAGGSQPPAHPDPPPAAPSRGSEPAAIPGTTGAPGTPPPADPGAAVASRSSAAIPGVTGSPAGDKPPAGSAAPSDGAPAPMSSAQRAFIGQVAPGAVDTQRQYGIPAAVTIAQAILESGWGSSHLAAADHNLFGVKGRGPAGSDTLPTQEYLNGQWVTTMSLFRVYDNVGQSISDHGRLLATSGYYKRSMAAGLKADAFANGLTGIYATDPQYGAKLIGLMKEFNLYQYDVAQPPASAPPRPPKTPPARRPVPRRGTPTPTSRAQPAASGSPTSPRPKPSPDPASPASTPRSTPGATPASTAKATPATRSATVLQSAAAAPVRATPVHRSASTARHLAGAQPAAARQQPRRTASGHTGVMATLTASLHPGSVAAAAQPQPASRAIPPPAPAVPSPAGRTAASEGGAWGRAGPAAAQARAARTAATGAAPQPRSRAGAGSRRGAGSPAALPIQVKNAFAASARAPLASAEQLYRDVAASTGIGWELLAACDWMECEARPDYSPVYGEKLGTANPGGTVYRTKSEALEQVARDLAGLALAVYGIDLTAAGSLSVRDLASAFAAFRWGGLLRAHHTSAMEFPYSVAGLTSAHLGMHWPAIDEPNAPDKPGARFRMRFGAVPAVLCLNYPATAA